MSPMTTVGRRGIIAVFAATIITTSACGTRTGTEIEDSTPQAPAAIQPAPAPDWPSSADSAERRGAAKEMTPPTPPPTTGTPAPAGKRVPD